jgi:glycine/D-amino acid oxidase-like deaminating enzyme/nitrite reductase/ring-hydroxylating ferredoxin subunit
MKSIWMPCERVPSTFAPLAGTTRVDVAVVGGGITGVLVAHRLRQAGCSVAVLERDRVGGSNTGLSTGNLYAVLSSGMAGVLERWDAAVLRHVAELRQDAVETIAQRVQQHGIECGLVRCPLVYAMGSAEDSGLDALGEERAAYTAAGLAPVPGNSTLPFDVAGSFHIEGQAQFNPYLFVQGMATLLSECGVPVHESSPVIDIDAGRGEVVTSTGTIVADHIVLATHTPPGFNLVQAEMEVHREYGIALPLSEPFAEGVHWIRDQGRSIRPCRHDGREWLVVVGEKHKTGEYAAGVDYAGRLEAWARERFDVGPVEARWSAQQFASADGLPYIGPSGHDNVWMATGYGADGLTWGAVAAQVICEGILGERSESARLLTPRRVTPMKSAKGWGKENATVVKHLVGDRLKSNVEGIEDVPAGEGRVLKAGGDRLAVYRDPEGKVTLLSPVCPHLKCLVQWNGAEKTWDCPCHGSRFTPMGDVIEGPALSGLSRA